MKPSATSSLEGNYFRVDHLKSDLKGHAVRGAGATIVSRIAIYGIQMFGTIVLARLLTPDDFGLVAMVGVFSNILVELGILRLNDATLAAEKIDHRLISTLFWINLGMCVVIAGALMAVSPVVALFYHEARLTLVTIVVSIGFVFNGLSVQHLALLQRNMQYYRIAGNQIAASCISTIIAIAMACEGWQYWSIVARQLTFTMAIALGAFVLCRWRPGAPRSEKGVWPMVKFGLNSLGSYSTGYLTKTVEKVLIGWRYGAQPLGYYERAYQLFVMPVNQLASPLTSVAVAALSRLRDDREKYCRYYLNAVSMLAFVGMPLSAMLTLNGKDFVLLLLGPQWKETGKIFTVFAPSIGVMILYYSIPWLHLSLGRADRYFRWGIAQLLVFVVAFVAGLPFGASGVACAYTVAFYVLIGPSLNYAGRPIRLGFRDIMLATWKYGVSAGAAGLLTWVVLSLVGPNSEKPSLLAVAIRMVISIALCASFYVLAIGALHRGIRPVWQFVSLVREMMPKKE